MAYETTVNRLELRRILCPVDFSPLSGSALVTAAAIARAHDAELRTLHVVPAEAGDVLDSAERSRLMALLRQQLEDVNFAPRRSGAAVRCGDPGMEILRFARTGSTDIIVMGAAGAGRPERPTGPVTSVVAARSECPVLTVPREHVYGPDAAGVFSRIVCGVDLAPSCAGVLQQALSLGWESNGRVTCVSVQPNEPDAADVRRRLMAWLPPEAERWCELDVVVGAGTAGAEIVRIADAANADLIVIGAPRRWTSTAHAVLGDARRPVLVTHDIRPLPRPIPRGVPEAPATASR